MSFKQGQWDRLLSVSTMLTMHKLEGWICLMWKIGTKEEETGVDKGQRSHRWDVGRQHRGKKSIKLENWNSSRSWSTGAQPLRPLKPKLDPIVDKEHKKLTCRYQQCLYLHVLTRKEYFVKFYPYNEIKLCKTKLVGTYRCCDKITMFREWIFTSSLQ